MKSFFKVLFVITIITSPLMAVYPPFPNTPPDGPQPMQEQCASKTTPPISI
ncbi:MAG: hypothetical protein KDK55_00845 [Chlamydiia bacterium]|nr:hypothetical protein [Chlamydiia bacterium]